MLRLGLVVALFGLTACAPPIPESNTSPKGVGFGDYTDYERYTATPPDRRTTVTPPPGGVATAGGNTAPPVAPGAVVAGGNNSGISDEQNFDAVSSRETIESDAERLRLQQNSFVEVKPTAVPERNGDTANIVGYALSTEHAVGTKMYKRGFTSQNRFNANCAGYASADLAQEAFLKAGGPNKDRLKLDPDGDGFACGWNPATYRRLAG